MLEAIKSIEEEIQEMINLVVGEGRIEEAKNYLSDLIDNLTNIMILINILSSSIDTMEEYGEINGINHKNTKPYLFRKKDSHDK